MEQKIKARIVLAHADTNEQQKALPNELILYDFEKPLANNLANKEIRLRIGDGKTSISYLPDLVLDNMNFYNSKPANPEIGDVWYNEVEETFYLGTGEGSIKLSHVIENIEDGLGNKSVQTTNSSKAGSMCFRFDSTKPHTQNKFYLLMTDEQKQKTFNVKDKKFSMKLDNNFDYAGVATSLKNGILKVQTLTATHNGAPAIPGTAGVGALAIDGDSFLFFPGEPNLGTDILGEGAVALGIDTKAQSNASFAEGRQTVSAGEYAHAEGRGTDAIGYSSHAEGLDTKAIGQRAHAEGDNTIAEGYGSHAQGQKTEAIGKQSHTEGVKTIAKGDQSHAEGLKTYTQGQGAHSEGIKTAAIGRGAHAEGRASTEPLDVDGKLQTWNKNAGLSIAEGEASHIEGINNHTGPNARAAHAEGELTEATGVSAHAEGKETQAVGEASHAEGIKTIANKTGQHVQGKYNKFDENNNYAHIVGNGTFKQRSNAHTLDWDGNAWYAGDIIAGTEDNQKDIIATGTLKGNSLDAITGEFNTINVGDEKASIDENGNIISPSITTSNGNFENITVKKEDNNIINLNGKTGEINTLGSIQAQGTGHFDNGLTVGGKHYGSNNYENPVLNYRGIVTNLTEITDAKPGDIVCIENLIEQKLIEFKVPKKEDGYIGDSFYEESTHLYTNEFREFQATSPYGKIVAFLLDDNKTYNITKEEWENSDAITHSNNELNEFKISFTFSDNNKTSIFIPSSSLRSRAVVGYGDPDCDINKKAFYDAYSVKGNLFYDGQLQDEFHNHDVIIKYVEIEKDMPPFENVPKELRKYAVAEPQETSNYYLYDGKEWNDLTYNGKQLQSLISSHCMPTIGYSKNSKYKVNVGGENIVDLLKQAFNEGESVVYIESGKYTSSKQYVLPQGNFTIIGLGDVNFNFVIYDNPTIKNKFIYTFNNITFSNILYFDYITDDKDGAYYYNSLKANNCQFNSVISIWPEGEFNRCIFSNSIESSSSHYTMAIFNQCEFYNISRIAGQHFIDCKFYYLNSEIEKIFFGGKYYQESFNFQNCIFQLNNKNIKCCCNIDNDENQQLLSNKEIKNSSFLQYPFANIECIDEETCYINSNVNYEDKDLHYKGITSSEELNKIIEKVEGDLYNVEDNVYKNGIGQVYYKIIPQDQTDSIECIGQYENYYDYKITGSSGGFANAIIDLYNLSEGVTTDLTNNIQIKLYSKIFESPSIIPYKAYIYSNEISGTQVQTMYELSFHYSGDDRDNFFDGWQDLQGNYITVSTLEYSIENYDKIYSIEKFDTREKIGTTNSLQVYKENNWENLIKGIPLNYKGQLEKYDYLPKAKNVGDLYSILSMVNNVYNHDQSGTFLGYNSLETGDGDIVFESNDSDSNAFTLTLNEDSELRKILCHYIGAYDFGTKKYKSIILSYNNYKAINLFYPNAPSEAFIIEEVEYDNDINKIKIKGTITAWEMTYFSYNLSKGETISIYFLNSASLINEYLDKAVYENSYPSGKWFWDGTEWVFFDQKEIVTDQIQYSTRDIEKNSNLKTGTLYIVYEEDDE